ncbi:MAG: biotin--[acetyl-CoA-carboxylase] ligase [Chlorobiaceae bacterium]
MNTLASQILQRLSSAGDFLSGEELSSELGITRSAVWKHIRLLRREGYTLEALPGLGYRLAALTGRPLEAEVRPFLASERLGSSIDYHPSAVSTNILAKSLAAEGAREGRVVVADYQSGGRGRMGRTWISPPGVNLYFSLILRPEVPSIRVPQLTLLLAVAIHRAISILAPELQAKIKWPNDILSGRKKLCGVLCEMQSEPDYTHFVVVGIGINVNQHEVPVELKESATSLFLETGRQFSRPELLAAVLNHFEPLYDKWLLQDNLAFVVPYLEEHSFLQSQEVTIEQGRRTISGRVSGVGRGGELKVETPDGRTVLLSSGEATLRKTTIA